MNYLKTFFTLLYIFELEQPVNKAKQKTLALKFQNKTAKQI